MPRPIRPHYPFQYYHIFNRGFDKKRIFRQTTDYLRFLEKLVETKLKFDWIIYSYCLLPNHYHLHIQTRKNSLANILHFLQTSHAVYFNRKYKHYGPVFTSRFKSVLIQKEFYHFQLSKYVHLNPVTAKLVKNPQDYSYSSYSEIINKPKHRYRIIDQRTMKSLAPGGIKQYRQLIEETGELNYQPQHAIRGILGTARFHLKFE